MGYDRPFVKTRWMTNASSPKVASYRVAAALRIFQVSSTAAPVSPQLWLAKRPQAIL